MAQRKVFISRLSKYVGNRPATKIQDELLSSNPNTRYLQVFKTKHSFYKIKIIFEDSETADTVIREGLFAFHIKIAQS